MGTVTVGRENSTPIELYYEDLGNGSPVVLLAGIPTLILHGTADRILPIDGQGRRLHAALPDAHYAEIDGGPHVNGVTHATEVNQELLAFLRQLAPVAAAV
jgi:pimeloyl-ACP methyl ester carboxylesterase